MDSLPLNIVDLAIIAAVAISAVMGLMRGLVREVLAIAAWIGAVFATLFGFGEAKAFAREYVSPELLADIIAGGAIFIVVLTILSGISKAVGKRVQGTFVGPLDRTLGTVFGLARGAFLVSVVYLAIAMISGSDAERPAWAQDSRLLPWARLGAGMVYEFAGSPEYDFNGFDQGEEIYRQIREKTSQVAPISDRPGETGYKTEERKSLEELIEKNK
ncbi:MAG: CvpA family protein [Sphingomonadales bacterium]